MEDAEFHLLVAACGASFDDRPINVRLANINWDHFLALTDRHRVQALCWNALGPFANEMPRKVAITLQAQAREIVMANLRTATECGRLLKSFATAGISLLFLKGLTLGALAYRKPFLKMGVDIDLLVGLDRLEDSARVLRSAGYDLLTPAEADDRSLSRWHAAHKESVWHRVGGGFQVDLHTRLADHPVMLPDLSATSPSQHVEVARGIALPTLNTDDLFAYLCVHGASSAWFRLKWITDFSALLHRKSASEIERLYDRSQLLGAGRAADQALLLAERIYSIGIGGDLRNRLAADPITRLLVWLAERQLFNSAEPTERFLGTATIHLSQLGLLAGWRFKASEAARQWRDMAGIGLGRQ